jgi:O-antigen/teichoic acid export membrane protein
VSGSARANLIANYLGSAWNAIMAVAFVPSYLAYLGPEAYGVIGLSAIVASMMTVLDLGLVPTLTREVARFRGGLHDAASIRSLLRVVEICVLVLGALALAAAWLSTDWVASDWLRGQSMKPGEIAHALRMLSVVVGIRFVEGLYRGVLIGLQRQVSSNLIGSLAATLRGVGSLGVLAWWSPTVSAFLWWQTAVSAFSLILFAGVAHAAIPSASVSMALGRRAFRTAWPFARGMIFSSFLVLGLTQADRLLLSRLLPLAEYGQYTLALVVASCVTMAAAPIGQAIYPRLTELHARADAIGFLQEFHRMAQLVSVVAGSIGAVLVVNSDMIIALWTGNPELSEAISNPVRLLAVGGILNSCMLAPYQCQLATGWTGISNVANVISIVLIIPALIITVPHAGMLGASAAWAGLNGGYVLVVAPFFFRRQFPHEIRKWYLRDLLMPIGSAFAACLVIRAGSSAFPSSSTSDMSEVLLCSIAAALAALGSAPSVRRQVIGAAKGIRAAICTPRRRA